MHSLRNQLIRKPVLVTATVLVLVVPVAACGTSSTTSSGTTSTVATVQTNPATQQLEDQLKWLSHHCIKHLAEPYGDSLNPTPNDGRGTYLVPTSSFKSLFFDWWHDPAGAFSPNNKKVTALHACLLETAKSDQRVQAALQKAGVTAEQAVQQIMDKYLANHPTLKNLFDAISASKWAQNPPPQPGTGTPTAPQAFMSNGPTTAVGKQSRPAMVIA